MSDQQSGFAVHVHHDVLVEHCWDYQERVAAMRKDKPPYEQEVRLRLFRLLPPEAVEELPPVWRKAYAVWQEARAALQKAYAVWQEADAVWRKTDAAWQAAYAAWQEADAAWLAADRDTWHRKWCGCAEWNGKELVFGRPSDPQ